MTPGNSDFLNAINAVQNLANAAAIPTGYVLLYSSTSQDSFASNALAGAAYVNPTTRQIIIAYSGPDTVNVILTGSGSTLQIAGSAVDARIGNNDPTVTTDMQQQVNSFTSAIRIAAEDGGYSFTNSNVFVAGWSEGGLLAQLTARTNGFAGASYGAPPIPGTDSNTAPENSGFNNYYYSKEPVGNFGSDRDIQPNTGKAYHYGNDIELGNPQDGASLAETVQQAINLDPSNILQGNNGAVTGWHDVGTFASGYHVVS